MRPAAREQALDQAAAVALTNPRVGVAQVVSLVNATEGPGDPRLLQIMDGARDRGFGCEFWPGAGGIGVRVTWEGKR